MIKRITSMCWEWTSKLTDDWQNNNGHTLMNECVCLPVYQQMNLYLIEWVSKSVSGPAIVAMHMAVKWPWPLCCKVVLPTIWSGRKAARRSMTNQSAGFTYPHHPSHSWHAPVDAFMISSKTGEPSISPDFIFYRGFSLKPKKTNWCNIYNYGK